jgi:hypothetical protein
MVGAEADRRLPARQQCHRVTFAHADLQAPGGGFDLASSQAVVVFLAGGRVVAEVAELVKKLSAHDAIICKPVNNSTGRRVTTRSELSNC